ncbi:MAG TPA: ABC transporter ATP-binding protein [Planctomycetota bacterium]
MHELRYLLPFLLRYRFRYLFGTLCIGASILLRIIIPHLLGKSIDVLRAAAGGNATVEAADARRLLVVSALTIFGAATATAFTRTASRLFLLGTSRRIVHDLRQRIFTHLLRLDPGYYLREQTGDLQSRAVNDAQFVQGLSGPVYMYLAETFALYAICLVFMLRIDVGLTLACLLPIPVFIVLARRLATVIQRSSLQAQQTLSAMSAKIDESLSGQLVIKSLAIEDYDFERFRVVSTGYRDRNLEVTRARATLQPLMIALAALSTLIVAGLGGPRVVRGTISLGDFVAMLLYLQMVVAPTGVLGFVISSLRRGAAAMGRIRVVLETRPTLVDPPDPAPGPVRHGALDVRALTVSLPLPRLAAHAAEPQERTVLRDVSFRVGAGRTLGVVGHVGSGKSMLLRALARQLDVAPGKIFVDGVDVTRMRLHDLRAAIGYVPQEAFLFSATLAENVVLGRPDAPREAIADAVRRARLDKDLDQLPDGLDTLLGERGVNLSGGQRQRTALARVMLLDPALLLLDDTLSAVDTGTAREILAELRILMAGRTTVIVSHRVAAVREADEILVLADGAVVERGTHRALVAHGGIYADLHRRQETRETLADELGIDPEDES